MLTLQAAMGIANLLCMAMKETGLSEEEAANNVYMVDIDGLLTVVSINPVEQTPSIHT